MTVPFPVPLAPDVTVIHDALLTAVHPQPLPAVTVTLPDPPLDHALSKLLDSLHRPAAAAFPLHLCPATVSVPDSVAVVVFGATV